LPSLFETRRRLPTSATTLSTCGQPNPGSFVSHRDEGLDLLPFLSPHALSLAEAVKSGELRFFVRSNRPQCWFFRVAPVCPTVMPIRSPHQPTLACWLHSEDLRAQVEGLSEGRVLCVRATVFSCLHRVHTLCGACVTAFPSSAAFGHPLSSARSLAWEVPTRVDGPT
jgi:hypothetical protein